MDYKKWKQLKKESKKLLDWTYYNKSHQLMKQFNINNNTNKTEVHHLMDTPEQIAYNCEHYEMWGHNLDGTFEYGKYVIFVTRKEHSAIHKISKDTRKKLSNANKGHIVSPETRKKISIANTGKRHSEETKRKISENSTKPNLGKHLSEETKKKISESEKGKVIEDWHRKRISEANSGKVLSQETKNKMSESKKGCKNPRFGKPGTMLGRKQSEESRKKMSDSQNGKTLSEEHKRNISKSCKGKVLSEEVKQKQAATRSYISSLYWEYKNNGGPLKWPAFMSAIKRDESFILQCISNSLLSRSSVDAKPK